MRLASSLRSMEVNVKRIFVAVPYGKLQDARGVIGGEEKLFNYTCAGWLSARFFYIYGCLMGQIVLFSKD